MRHGPYIVLEGGDGTGKTVLAQHLEQKYGFRYVHCGPPTTEGLKFYMSGLRRYEGPVVADRLHVGSFVYTTAFQRGPELSEQDNWLVDGFLRARGAVLVHCEPPVGAVAQNLARGPDSDDAKIYERPEKQAEVRELFRTYFFGRVQLPWAKYDYALVRMERFAEGLVEHAYRLGRRAPAADVSAVGNTDDPKWVFVGDRPSEFDRVWKRFPTAARAARVGQRIDPGYCWGNSPSGRYLYRCLVAAGLRLADYCSFNAVQWDGRHLDELRAQDPDWFGRISDRADVVALGELAAVELTEAGIPHRTVPHPQFVRRFHYKRIFDYAALLRGDCEYRRHEWRST